MWTKHTLAAELLYLSEQAETEFDKRMVIMLSKLYGLLGAAELSTKLDFVIDRDEADAGAVAVVKTRSKRNYRA